MGRFRRAEGYSRCDHRLLNREVNAGLADPAIKASIARLGATVLVLSPPEFGKLIAEDMQKWAKVIRAANITPN